MIEPLAATPSLGHRLTLAVVAALSGLLVLASPAATASAAQERADRMSYVLLSPGGTSATMSGSTDDMRRARSLRNGQEGLLYVRRGGAAWVIRDAETLRRAQALFASQQALGAQQGELGSRQAALGQRQAALGAEQGRLGRQLAGASPRRSEELSRQQEELGRRQEALGEQQEALGRRQEALGREQERLGREAEAGMRSLVADAIRRGVAQPVD
ncbi:MAG TPA: hypothetical protein VGB08_10375 [Allosphingosinicella sp.]|jgi:hypothetical protein